MLNEVPIFASVKEQLSAQLVETKRVALLRRALTLLSLSMTVLWAFLLATEDDYSWALVLAYQGVVTAVVIWLWLGSRRKMNHLNRVLMVLQMGVEDGKV